MQNSPADAPAGPHAVELTVWDVPSATGAGERFRFAVGARCSAGCNVAGRELNLFDHKGREIGAAKLGRDVWPGTEALYFAEVEATAPLETGSHQWEAKIAGWNAKPPHAAGSFPLIVCVVGTPDCVVTVRAIDRESQTPLKGARVVMHPYRALTDDDGIAKVRVTRGQYDLMVSASRYLPASTSVEVADDMIITTELDADRPDEDQEE